MRWTATVALLVAGCHLAWPLSPGAPDGPAGGRPDVVVTDLERDAPTVAPDVGPPDHGPPPGEPAADLTPDLPANDLPTPSCAATVVFNAPPIPANGWVLEGGCLENGSNLECQYDQEGAAYLVKTVAVPASCGLTFYVVGSFSGGQLDLELHEVACTNINACRSSGTAPPTCTLKTLSGSANCSPSDADVAGRTFQTIRIYRPGGTLVGAAKVSYFKVTTL